MSAKTLLTASRPQEYAQLPLFPRSPVLSSLEADWQGLYLEYHQQPAYDTPKHFYGWYVISIHLGHPVTVEVWSDRQRLQRKSVLPGEINIYAASRCYRERSDRDGEFIDLHLDPNCFSSAVHEAIEQDQLEIAPVFGIRDPLIQQIGLELKTELELSADRLYAELMANALIVHLLRRYSSRKVTIAEPTGGLSNTKLRQVIDFIYNRLDQELTVTDIADVVQISPYHFSRLFKQSTGLTPHQYVIQCRVERAKQLLLQGEMELAEIADAVGFANQSHLNRHFKRCTGTTPTAFLQM